MPLVLTRGKGRRILAFRKKDKALLAILQFEEIRPQSATLVICARDGQELERKPMPLNQTVNVPVIRGKLIYLKQQGREGGSFSFEAPPEIHLFRDELCPGNLYPERFT